MKNNQKKDAPVFVARSGSIAAQVWEKFFQNGCEYKITLNCSYKDKNEQWQRGRTFFADELPRIAEVIARTEQWIRRQQRPTELPADCPVAG